LSWDFISMTEAHGGGGGAITEGIKVQETHTESDLNSLQATICRANAGDPAAIAELRRFLDANPHVWRHLGDLAKSAERAWITLIAEGNALAAQAIQRQLDEIRGELIGKEFSAVGKMLADQVVATLLEVKYLETVTANSKGGTAKQETTLLRRLESAQRRHLAAIKSLEQTRKMLSEPSVAPYLRVIGARATA
jgi:hypothetical protein